MGNDINCCRGKSEDYDLKDPTLEKNYSNYNNFQDSRQMVNIKSNANFHIMDDNQNMNEKNRMQNNNLNENNLDTYKLLSEFEYKEFIEIENKHPIVEKQYLLNEYSVSYEKLMSFYSPFNVKTTYESGLVINNEKLYVGEVNSEKIPHGFGAMYNKDNFKYTGFFINGEFGPLGRLINKNLIIHEGFFSMGELNGKGKEITSNSEYIGEFTNGLKHGLGVLHKENEIYTGNFVNGIKQGLGSIEFLKTKNKYTGDFINGIMEGKGIFKWENGDCYEGGFVNGVLQGHGVYNWNNGDRYEGSYENGLRSGFGKLINANGKIYEGGFKNNNPHGKGIIRKGDKILDVEFNNGVFISKKNSIKSYN